MQYVTVIVPTLNIVATLSQGTSYHTAVLLETSQAWCHQSHAAGRFLPHTPKVKDAASHKVDNPQAKTAKSVEEQGPALTAPI
eukprot:6143478-Amphidinium_carterae.1